MDISPTAARGVHRAKQARSQAKHEALLQAGRRLLESEDLGSLSVAQLTSDAGMSVGSFYSRFDDKDAWFAELVRVTGDQVLDETQRLLASPRWAQASSERKVASIVRHLVDVHRLHRGIFRAAHLDLTHSQPHWAQLQGYARRIADAVHQALAEQMPQVPPAQRRLRVGVGLQIVFGTLVNAVLHDPGPIALYDKRLEKELSQVFMASVVLG